LSINNNKRISILLVLMMAVMILAPAALAAGAPVAVFGEVTNKGDYSLSFDQALADPAGTQAQFAVTVDGQAVAVQAVETTNTVGKIKFTLATKATPGQVVAVEYVQSENPDLQLRSADGVAVASFTYGETQQPQPAAPPALTADSTDAWLGQAIQLTFAGTPDWSSQITNVKVDDVSIRGQYTVGEGSIIIAADVFAAAKDYAIVVKATGYDDASLTQVLAAKPAEEPGPVTPPVTLPVGLRDINGHWAQANIEALVAVGAISGNPDGTFRPDQKISRAEFASVLVHAFALQPGSAKTFTDTENHWAQSAISIAYANGIITGYSDTQFGPADTITREQMAVMIVKAAKVATGAGTADFADAAQISDGAVPFVLAAVDNQFMNGYPGNLFGPAQGASRAEAVTVILNALP